MRKDGRAERARSLGARLDEMGPNRSLAVSDFNEGLAWRFLELHPELADEEVESIASRFEAWVRARLPGWPVLDEAPSEGWFLYGPGFSGELEMQASEVFDRIQHVDPSTFGRDATLPSLALPIADDLLERLEALMPEPDPTSGPRAFRLALVLRDALEHGVDALERARLRRESTSVPDDVLHARQEAGRRLRQWRLASGQSALEQASSCHVFESTWLALERGEQDPGFLADLLEMITGIRASDWRPA
jgi:hypothetical protein